MTRELPIIFCPEMVKAIYEERKTNTRRIEGLKRLNDKPDDWVFDGWVDDPAVVQQGEAQFTNKDWGIVHIKPRYRVGDELWVKETWAADRQYDSMPPRAIPAGSNIWFPDELGWKRDKHMGKVRSSRFMPKKFARLWLRVTAVKDPHQIQTISDKDILAEGIVGDIYGEEFGIAPTSDPRSASIYFVDLWNRLHKKPGERWEDNSWAFPYVFKRIPR